jgi:hypothetical protein
MRECLRETNRVLKPGKYCVLVLGDVERNGKSRRTAELVGELAESESLGSLRVQELVNDEIPDIRRSRRMTRTTKVEKILVLKKAAYDAYRTEEHRARAESATVRDKPRRARTGPLAAASSRQKAHSRDERRTKLSSQRGFRV